MSKTNIMVKKLSILYCLVFTLVISAQKTEEVYISFFKNFITKYNATPIDEMASLVSPEMSISSDKFVATMKSLRTGLGTIDSYDYVGVNDTGFALFKVNFSQSVMGMHLVLDNANKLLKLTMKPFESFDTNDNQPPVFNALSLTKNSISKLQQEYIYEYSKGFHNHSELAIGLIKNGVVCYYGVRKLNDTIRYVDNPKSQFEIGSVTKVFTASLLAHMVLEDKVKLSDNVFDYLKITDKEKITFQSLANHTSGLPRLPTNLNLSTVDPKNPYKLYDEDKLLTYLKEDYTVETRNAQSYEYSNLGAGLLGFTLAKIENMSYENLLGSAIFSKFKMDASTTKSENATQLVTGRNEKGEPTKNWDMSSLAGAGAIISTVEDVSKFVLAHFDDNNEALALTQVKTAAVNATMNIGLGWHLRKSNSNTEWLWHNGGTGGYTSSVTIDPKTRNGIIILSNVSAYHSKMSNIDALNFALMKTLE